MSRPNIIVVILDALRTPRYEVASTASLALLLEEGLGYGIVPAMTAQPKSSTNRPLR